MIRTKKDISKADPCAAAEGLDGPCIVVARNWLMATSGHLEVALAAAVVCGLALKGQGLEHDREISTLVRRSVADPLGHLIESLEQGVRERTTTDGSRSSDRRKAGRAGRTKLQELRIPP